MAVNITTTTIGVVNPNHHNNLNSRTDHKKRSDSKYKYTIYHTNIYADLQNDKLQLSGLYSLQTNARGEVNPPDSV